MHELQAYAGRYLWVRPDNPGQPDLGPHLLPDGTDVWDLVSDGRTDRLDFVPRFRRSGGGKQVGDLLWTAGTSMKVASQGFVDVLESVRATGYRTFEIDLVDGRRRPMAGFLGFAVDVEAGPEADVRNAHPWQSFRFVVTDALMQAFEDADVTRYRRTRTTDG